MKNIKFLLALFFMLLFASVCGAVVGSMVVLRIHKPKEEHEDLEDLEDDFIFEVEEEKKKNELSNFTTLCSLEQPIITDRDLLGKLLEIGRKVKEGVLSLAQKYTEVMKVRRTPCQRRFRISHEGLFWIPQEYLDDYSDIDSVPHDSDTQHYFIRNLFLNAD